MKNTRPRLAGELVFCCLLLLLSAFLLWSAFGISGFASYTSAGSFPMAAAAAMLVSGLLILVQTARAPRAPGEAGESLARQFARQVTPRVVVLLGVGLGLYMFALERLGFLVSSWVFLVAGMWLLGNRRPLVIVLSSAGALAAIHVVFQTAFSVVLPSGSLWQGVFK